MPDGNGKGEKETVMKNKIFSILLCFCLLFTLVACGEAEKETERPKPDPPVVDPLDPDEEFKPWEDIPEATEPVDLNEQILIGSWVTYYRYNIASHDTQMRRLAQAGINFNLFPFQWDTENWDSIEDWKQIDELCCKYRIVYGICANEDLNGANRFSLNQIKEYYAELDSPYCRFVNLKDEPTTAVIQGTIKRYFDQYREALPNLVPFTNLLPSYGTGAFSPTYREYIQAYVDACPDSEYISTDFYPFLAGGKSYDSKIFSDMEVIRDVAYTSGKIKTHSFLQSTGFTEKRMTDLNEIRWNIYSYLAYGFKAFSYFNYVCPGESDTEGEGFYDSLIYRDGTIRDQDLFNGVSALNWQVRALSLIVMNSDVSAAYHTAEGYEGVKMLPSDYFLRPKTDGDFIVSYMENKDASQNSHVMLFNNDYTNSVRADFILDSEKGVSGLEYFNPERKEYEKVSLNDGSFTLSFDAGEGKIFRLLK